MRLRTCKYHEIQHFQNEDDTGIVEFINGKNMIWFCADLEDQIVGCVALRLLSDKKSRLNHIYVKSQFRGSGIASKLTETLIFYAMTLGIKEIEVTSKSSIFSNKYNFKPTGTEYKVSGKKMILEL